MGRAHQIEGIISKGQLVPLKFTQAGVAASQSNVQLEITNVVFSAGTSDATLDYPSNDEYVMPFDGEIVAISAELTAAATAGSLTVGPTKDGTEESDPTLSITTATEAYDTCLRGTATFVAGDRIGCEITTDASWDGTSADLTVLVWVLVNIEGV
jgi:hypothetical protein